jgi:hypothetical protein
VLAHLRVRLTYANVVATLALFLALGGSSYAALSITSKDIKNRSIKGGDIVKDTIGPNEIKESRLGTVPRATSATSASSADLAKNADNATNAVNSQNAQLAAAATNAQQLAGQAAGNYEKSTRTQFGKAANAPAGVSGEAAVLTWPELGVQITTAASGSPCDITNGGSGLAVAIKNTKAAGGAGLQVYEVGFGSEGSVPAQGKAYQCSSTGSDNINPVITDSSGRTLFVQCLVSAGELRCIGTRSEP